MRGDGRCSLSVSCRWSAAGSRSCHTASPGTSASLRPQFQPTHSPLRSMDAVLGISPARWRGERSDVGFARWSTLSSHSLRLERRDAHAANCQRTCRSAPRVCPRGLPPVAGLSPPPSGGRCNPEQLLVEQLPVRSDLLLGRAEVDRSGAHRLVRAVLQFVFHVIARRVPWKGRLLRVQVGDVVRAAELQRNNVVDLKRAPTASPACPLSRTARCAQYADALEASSPTRGALSLERGTPKGRRKPGRAASSIARFRTQDLGIAASVCVPDHRLREDATGHSGASFTPRVRMEATGLRSCRLRHLLEWAHRRRSPSGRTQLGTHLGHPEARCGADARRCSDRSTRTPRAARCRYSI